MVRGYISMHRNIIARVLELSAAENDSAALYVCSPEPSSDIDQCYTYKVPVLPLKQSHFVLIIRLPTGSRAVKLLFSFKNLYLMGFLYQNMWYLFSDHELLAGVSQADQAQWTRRLGFKGSYTNGGLLPDFFNIKMGKQPLFNIVWALANFGNITEAMAKEMLTTTSVMVSECIRFPTLKNRVIVILSTGASQTVNFIEDSTEQRTVAFSPHFNKWNIYCSKACEGEEAFQPMVNAMLQDFRALLRFLGVVKMKA